MLSRTKVRPVSDMRLLLTTLATCAFGAVVFAGDPRPAPAASAESDDLAAGRWVFTLVPKAFQKNPVMDMTAFTEMTEYGRALPAASLLTPVYYTLLDSGEKSRGYLIGGEHPPPREVLDDLVRRTLAEAGYVRADATHRPSLLLHCFWGSHNRLDPELARQFPQLAEQYAMERAALVGGPAYVRSLSNELNYGAVGVDPRRDFLRLQAEDSIYYVVVSAYDYVALARNQRHLAWRTTMTVNSVGISMTQSLPSLIVAGGNYFGRETTEPRVLRRDVHSGSVKLGPMQILDDNVPDRALHPAN